MKMDKAAGLGDDEIEVTICGPLETEEGLLVKKLTFKVPATRINLRDCVFVRKDGAEMVVSEEIDKK